MEPHLPRRHGRGAASNPANRFERLHLQPDPSTRDEDERRQVPTAFFEDTSRSALAENHSPDIPFTYGLNPYRGCEHGCVYCYARPTHEYLGFSAGLDFETKILVKRQAPVLLAKTFEQKSWVPSVISLSGVTDPYQPIERSLGLTRRCLEVLLRYRNPVSIITKNHLVTRDLDLLTELAARDLVHVMLSVTTLRPELVGRMEPRTSRPDRRLEAIRKLHEAGVPVGVMVAPIIPGLTDEEMPAILAAAAGHGAQSAGYTIVQLPGAVRELFLAWLAQEMPDRAAKVQARLRSLRGEALDDRRFGHRMRGEGLWADLLRTLFKTTCRKLGLNQTRFTFSTAHFRRMGNGQLSLFAP